MAGIIFLAALMWRTHSLPRNDALTAPARAQATTAPAWPVKPAAPRSAGTDISIPVEGVAAGDLHDDFQEARNGHIHEALDILAPRGTPVLAAGEGSVVKLFLSKPGGLTVYQFDNSRNWCFYYAHLDHYAKELKEGMLLRKGDVLGYVGTTGDAPANTPHLHFAIFRLGPEKHWWQGTAVDPFPFLTGKARWPPE